MASGLRRLIVLAPLVSSALFAQGGSGSSARPHELLGFLLRQDQGAFDRTLGKPFHIEHRPDGTCIRGYQAPGTSSDYLLAFFSCGGGKATESAAIANTLQLTGDEELATTGFFGLRIGDPAMDVMAALGKPSAIRHESDVNVDLWDYAPKNFSVEISASRRLYSIQILDEATPAIPELNASGSSREFAEAIVAENINRIAELASGEIECTRSDAVYGLHAGPARAILSDPRSPISACLLSAAHAVLALGPETKGAEDAIRLWEDHSEGMVTKFPATSALKEIVWKLEAGSWRVYEVTFR